MPQVAIAAGSAALTAAASAAITGATITITDVLVAAAIAAAATGISIALAGKPNLPRQEEPFAARIEGRTTQVRSTILPRRIVYGDVAVGSQVTLLETSGSTGQFLHLVLPLADHRIDDVVEIWANDVKVGARDASGMVTEGRFANKMRIKIHLGHDDAVADNDLVSEVSKWTPAHRGRGMAYAYIRLEADPAGTSIENKVYPTGIPVFKFRIRGKHVYDPRDPGIPLVSATAGKPALFTSASAHGLAVRDRVWLSDDTGATLQGGLPARGEFQVDTVPSATTFTLLGRDGEPLHLELGGAAGKVTKMAWSNNWALIVRDYATNEYSIGVTDDEIGETHWQAAANVSDEDVLFAAGIFSRFTPNGVDAAADTIRLENPLEIPTGETVRVATDGALPAPLLADTDYYAIQTLDPAVYQIAASRSDAYMGLAINLTSQGTGTHRWFRRAQARYEANGMIQVDGKPIDILEDLMTGGFGALDWTSGKYRLHAGAFTPPSFALDERDLRDVHITEAGLPRADTYNAVRAVYVDPFKRWESDEILRRNKLYEAEDGGREQRDIQLPFTSERTRAARIAEAHLRDSRQGIQQTWPANLRTAGATPWDVAEVSLGDMGWSAKPFRMLGADRDLAGGTVLRLKETAASIYEWDGGAEETADAAPNTDLPQAVFVSQPTGLGVSTDAGDNIVLEWNQHADEYVRNGGRIEVFYRAAGAATWIRQLSVPGDATTASLALAAGTWDLAIRAVNAIGRASIFAVRPAYTRGDPPEGVTSREDWGELSDAVTSSEDWGELSDAVTSSEDWGELL